MIIFCYLSSSSLTNSNNRNGDEKCKQNYVELNQNSFFLYFRKCTEIEEK